MKKHEIGAVICLIIASLFTIIAIKEIYFTNNPYANQLIFNKEEIREMTILFWKKMTPTVLAFIFTIFAGIEIINYKKLHK